MITYLKSFMKKRISKLITKILSSRNYHHISKYDRSFLEGCLLSLKSQKSKNNRLKIIQVGANVSQGSDKQNQKDPLFRFLKKFGSEISILFVEPQITLKDELIKNTKNICSEVFYDFVAVSPNKGKCEFFVPNPEYFPNASGISSVIEENVLIRVRKRYKQPELNKHYLKISVPLKNLTEISNVFCDKYKINESKKICDFLLVDTEGFDDQVIYSIEDKSTLPDLISFEWKNMKTENFKKLTIFLEDNGYICQKWSHADCMAFKIKN